MVVDLNEPDQRQRLCAAIGSAAGLLIAEGLLMYVPKETARALATEPPATSGLHYFLVDMTSSGGIEGDAGLSGGCGGWLQGWLQGRWFEDRLKEPPLETPS